MPNLEERIWELERGARDRRWLAKAKGAAITRLDAEELEVVEQVVDSIGDMQTSQELASVLEVLDASFGDVPHRALEKYAAPVEEEYQLLQREEEAN